MTRVEQLLTDYAEKITIYWKASNKLPSEYMSKKFSYIDDNTLTLRDNNELIVIERKDIAEVVFDL